MTRRFVRMVKIPDAPAARLLAAANARIVERTGLPAIASVCEVLEALDQRDAHIDMLRLLSVALPPRERVWWACLSARDIVTHIAIAPPPTLTTAEEWVRSPSDASRAAARAALDAAPAEDDLSLCATAAVFADGTLGPGELARLPAPPGASEAAVFAMNVMCIARCARQFEIEAERLIDRAVDIAQGGNGKGRT